MLRSPCVSSWTANLINILLNPCLIFGMAASRDWASPGSGIGTTIGRGCGVLDTALVPVRRQEPRPRCVSINSGPPARPDVEASAPLAGRHVPEPDWHGQLDRAGSHHRHISAVRRLRGLYPGDPHHDLRAAAELGHGERGRDYGRPEPGCGQSRIVPSSRYGARDVYNMVFSRLRGGRSSSSSRNHFCESSPPTRRWLPWPRAPFASCPTVLSSTPGAWCWCRRSTVRARP